LKHWGAGAGGAEHGGLGGAQHAAGEEAGGLHDGVFLST